MKPIVAILIVSLSGCLHDTEPTGMMPGTRLSGFGDGVFIFAIRDVTTTTGIISHCYGPTIPIHRGSDLMLHPETSTAYDLLRKAWAVLETPFDDCDDFAYYLILQNETVVRVTSSGYVFLPPGSMENEASTRISRNGLVEFLDIHATLEPGERLVQEEPGAPCRYGPCPTPHARSTAYINAGYWTSDLPPDATQAP